MFIEKPTEDVSATASSGEIQGGTFSSQEIQRTSGRYPPLGFNLVQLISFLAFGVVIHAVCAKYR